jgi:hypothetical protein
MARCALQNKCVPNRFRVEAMFIAIYLLNRSPKMVVKQKTTKEAWSRRKPKVNHLKVFGSTTYTWIPNEKWTKLDPKRKKMMITRYNENHKSYRFVDINTNKVTFSRDVVVHEEVRPFHTSPKFKITKKPMVDKDLGVKLQATPPEGVGGRGFWGVVVSRHIIFYADSLNQHSDDMDTGEDEENPKKRPKWWHNTIGDVRIGEMIKGESSRGKSKQKPNTVLLSPISRDN